MTVQVVTGFHPAGWEQYGRRMIETFAVHWPAYVKLAVYVEEPTVLARGELRYIHQCQGWDAFHERHKDNPITSGKAEPEPPLRWNDKERRNGYSYRFDAHKFGRMAYYVEDAARRAIDDEIELLLWFDGDTYTHKKVPNGWPESLMEDADFATLFRTGKHPEIGFQGYRLTVATARQLIRSFWLMYDRDLFLPCPEWHSAYILGELARGHGDGLDVAGIKSAGMRIKNLAWGTRGHVWHESPLTEYTDHLKGDTRKRAGRSREMKR